MTQIQLTQSDATTVLLDETVVQLFAASLRGRLIGAADPDYHAARAVWNGMIDRHPALIARCAGTDDVVKAVDFARTHGLLVSVRGGGHNVAGSAVCDGGLVIDLSPMKEIHVDPAARTVCRAGGPYLGGTGSGHAGIWSRHTRRARLRDGHCGADPRRRHRLAAQQAWPELRQPDRRRNRHSRRADPHCQCPRTCRPVLGPARRRR